MRSLAPAGRKMVTVPLPGDADDVLDADTARAIRRDGQLNLAEWHARANGASCAQQRWKWGPQYWPCNPKRPCVFCEENK